MELKTKEERVLLFKLVSNTLTLHLSIPTARIRVGTFWFHFKFFAALFHEGVLTDTANLSYFFVFKILNRTGFDILLAFIRFFSVNENLTVHYECLVFCG